MKWCSLPYEDSTWELKEDVDEGKIREFKRIQSRHPELKRVVSTLHLDCKAHVGNDLIFYLCCCFSLLLWKFSNIYRSKRNSVLYQFPDYFKANPRFLYLSVNISVFMPKGIYYFYTWEHLTISKYQQITNYYIYVSLIVFWFLLNCLDCILNKDLYIAVS